MPDKRTEERVFLRQWTAGLSRQPLLKLVSFLIAVGGWLYVQGEQVVDERIQAEVAWTPPVHLLPTETLPRYVSVAVQGSVSTVRKAQRARVIVKADLSQATAGETLVEFAALPMEGLPGKLAIQGVSPSSIQFTLDEGTTRKVALSSITVGTPGEGYEVVGVEIDPPVVEVYGPRSLVEPLVEVQTMPIDVSGMAGDSNLSVKLDLPRQVRLAENVALEARVDVEPAMGIRSFPDVSVVFPKGEWRGAPDQVMVRLRGPASVLREILPSQVLVVAQIPESVTESELVLAFGPSQGPRLELVYPGVHERVDETLIPQSIQVRRR
ncbi:MAG: hypothetical protein JXX28_15520 [Deltaproteobacteria bacterium]|nr:hypothetical protein [Deltaproteobacteria bacterium]